MDSLPEAIFDEVLIKVAIKDAVMFGTTCKTAYRGLCRVPDHWQVPPLPSGTEFLRDKGFLHWNMQQEEEGQSSLPRPLNLGRVKTSILERRAILTAVSSRLAVDEVRLSVYAAYVRTLYVADLSDDDLRDLLKRDGLPALAALLILTKERRQQNRQRRLALPLFTDVAECVHVDYKRTPIPLNTVVHDVKLTNSRTFPPTLFHLYHMCMCPSSVLDPLDFSSPLPLLRIATNDVRLSRR